MVENTIAILVILVASLLLFFFMLLRGAARQNKNLARLANYTLRTIPGMRALRQASGQAIEEGKRIHVSIGSASVLSSENATALTGLATLDLVAQGGMISDRPPIATSGDGASAILCQDTLHSVYKTGNALDYYAPERGRLTGVSPFSYAAGAQAVIRNEQVGANIFIGNFGPEAALLTDATEAQNSFSIAGSESLSGQAVLFSGARQPLIGEEVFAIPAYLQGGAAHVLSLRVQDIFRWGIILVVLIGAFYKLAQALLGAAF